jgi:hypothetical protein
VSLGTFVIPFGSGSKSGSGSPKTKRSGSDGILIYNTVFCNCIVALPAVIIATTVCTVHIIDKEKILLLKEIYFFITFHEKRTGIF